MIKCVRKLERTYEELVISLQKTSFLSSKLTSTSITGVVATTADPTVFGKTDHGLLTGDIVTLSGFSEMVEINGMTGTVDAGLQA